MSIQQQVGQRIRASRESRGLSQAMLGDRMGVEHGLPWPRQTVSLAEKGKRAFTAAELWAIAEILGVEVGALFPSNHGDAEVQLVADARALRVGRAVIALMEQS